MMSFDHIARKLLEAHGYEVELCVSEEEAVEKAAKLRDGTTVMKKYPVYFSVSDTSGEKPFEEFYTEQETVEWERFKALGVVTGKKIPEQARIQQLFENLENALMRKDVTKEDIVQIIAEYLPNFEHLETGKFLDSKM